MTTKLKLSVLFFALVCGFQSLAQTVTPTILQVYVTDRNNNPVPNYDVLVRPNAFDPIDEIIATTNSNGYWSDTVDLPEDLTYPGSWTFSISILDSLSTGIVSLTAQQSRPMGSPNTVLDTMKFKLSNPLKALDNCAGYQVYVDSVVNDPMFVLFKNDLNRVKTGTTWIFGDGDTGHAPQSFHRFDTAGTYYYCHYTDSCGPVCDSVTVPTNVPTCVIDPFVGKANATLQGVDVGINHNYPSSLVDSVEWTFSGGIPSSNVSWYGPQFFPTGDYEYCVQINQCPVFCDSIHVNTDCKAGFKVTKNTGTEVWALNTSLPKSGDSLEVNYYWDLGDGNISTSKYPSHVYTVQGTYTVCLVIEVKDLTYSTPPVVCTTEYCESISGGDPATGAGFTLNVKNPNVGVVELDFASSFTMFPNPVKNTLTISADNEEYEIEQVQIFDLSGSRLFQVYNEEGSRKQEMQLDLRHLKTGIYVVTIHSGSGVSSTYKLVKK